MAVAIGKKVPKLVGVGHDGERIALADFTDHHVVVYFYPKDNTPGCTREAQDFRDLYPKFRRRNCAIIGVSRDSVASHARFRDKLAAPFPLVADEDESWCRAFDVIGEKMLYGKRHVGVIRSTFLIGPGGVLEAEWRKVKVPGHAQAVLDRIAASTGAG